MTTRELVEVFNDTMAIIESDEVLKEATRLSRGQTRCYREGFTAQNKRVKSDGDCVKVVEDTTFHCAHGLYDGETKIAVLNFANPYEPGGGVKRGSRAQEECLCRCGNLYQCITSDAMFDEYYNYHKNGDFGDLFSDRVIYSPSVAVIKADGTYERLAQPFFVDVLTCAAPYNVYGIDREILKSTLISRLTNIFEVAADNDADCLVLGAFGCGVFHNPPEMMAETFKNLICEKYHKYFKAIYFAIPKTSVFDHNLDAFSSVFGK